MSTEKKKKKSTDSPNFLVTDQGVFFTNENENHQLICSRLDIIAKTRSNQNDNWGLLLKFKDDDGFEHTWPMPMELLSGDGTEYRSHLLNRGLKIVPGKSLRDKLSTYLLNTHTEKRARCVTQVGWYDFHYILPNEAIGPQTEELICLQLRGEPTHKLLISGTLQQWQDHVGKLCQGNSRLILGTSIGFAAPLLHLLGEEGGGFHLRGPSSTGKSTALSVSGSIWGGGGKKGYVESWRNTANGLEATAALHNDALLALDELSQCDPREAGEIAYMLANGSGKGRATRTGDGRKRTEWRLLFFSSGEIDLATLIQQAGHNIRAGQEIRMVDIPADTECGLGIFENIHDFKDSQTFADALRARVQKFYGTPIREFLSKIIQNRELAINLVKKIQAEFLHRHNNTSASPEIGRVASRMGLVAAAGELAIGLKIVPWNEGDAFAGVGTCFNAWLESRGSIGSGDMDRAMAQIREFLQIHGTSRFPLLTGENHSTGEDRALKRAGFRKKLECGAMQWFIFKETFRNEVCKGFDYKSIERELVRLRYLKQDTSGSATVPRSLPDLGKTRVYILDSTIIEEAVPPVPDVPLQDSFE